MDTDKDILKLDVAYVTSRGVDYAGLLYSCKAAVYEGWFDERFESKKIAVYVDGSTRDYILLKLNEESLSIALLLDNLHPWDELQIKKYQEKLNDIRLKLKRFKK
jgi:hypothetical protein